MAPHTPTPANRLGIDYRAAAASFDNTPFPDGIIDAHLHVNGAKAAAIFRRVMDAYHIRTLISQTQLAEAAAVRDVLGERIRFVAIPDYMSEDRGRAHREAFLENIQTFHDDFNAKIVKFWRAPRFRDYLLQADPNDTGEDLVALDSEWVVRAAELATSLGMVLMTHVADPDTWFQTTYADSSRYGTKRDQYLPLERMLDRFPTQWLLAHMGGTPEDLDFLDGLLTRHPNAHLDTSACKWMVRELSKHDSAKLRDFLTKWAGRISFGSDIVTSDGHLVPTDPDNKTFGIHLANSEDEAFDLYASRYWALRTLFETDHAGESPIADPDLAMVDPEHHDAMSAPMLRGRALPADLLHTLHFTAAQSTLFANSI